MLVHVTRFNDVQQQVADLVGTELAYIKDLLDLGDTRRENNLLDELKALWDNDFVPTQRGIRRRRDTDPGVMG